MICFDKLWVTMKEKDTLRTSCGRNVESDSKTIRRLRANENVETKTLDKLCSVLECGLEDIAEHQPDPLQK